MVLAHKSKNLKKKKEEKMRRAILQALEDRYNAQISEADATIKIYLLMLEELLFSFFLPSFF